jgi:hypothetical protein
MCQAQHVKLFCVERWCGVVVLLATIVCLALAGVFLLSHPVGYFMIGLVVLFMPRNCCLFVQACKHFNRY